jgi:cytochrome P450
MTATGTVDFDPFGTEFFEDPSDTYRRLRDEAPVFHSDRYDFYALSRYDDVAAASLDWQRFSSEHGVDLHTLMSGRDMPVDLIIMMDPPAHDRMRALVSRVFTPRAIAALDPMIRDVVTDAADALAGRDTVDAVADFAALFPVEVISRMLGVPAADRQQLRLWIDVMLHREPGDPAPTQAGIDAGIAAGTYYFEMVADKRLHPGDDMLSRLAQVEVDRGDGTSTGLDDAEIAGFAMLLGGAGAETVTKLFGNAVVLFDQHRDQWQLVLDDPGTIPAAIEEILRYLPPSQYQGRWSAADIELHGTTIPAGHPVLLVTGAATRDERAYEDPDRFDITRPASLSLAFGYGVHSCIGAALARSESRIALELLRERYPNFEVDRDGLRRVHMSNVAGYCHVPIRVAP